MSDRPTSLTSPPKGYAEWLGVAEYKPLESLPSELQTSLPSIEQIERELGGDDSAGEHEEP